MTEGAVESIAPAALAQRLNRLLGRSGTGQPGAAAAMRAFSIWEITRYLIPVAPGHLRRVLREAPDLPQGRAEGINGTRWFTLEEVLRIRAHLAARDPGRYLPPRGPGRGAVITLAGTLPGSGKTLAAAHLAIAAALDGYRVLAIDLDPRGGLTPRLAAAPRDGPDSAGTLFSRPYVQHLRARNRDRLRRGEDPASIDERLARAVEASTATLPRPSRWPHLDLIAAGPDLSRTELSIPAWRLAAPDWRPWRALRDALEDGDADLPALLDRYDLIVIDTPPVLGQIPLSGIAAADILLVPTPVVPEALARTAAFLELLAETLGVIEDGEVRAARSLGTRVARLPRAALRLVASRVDPATHSEAVAALHGAFGSDLGPALLPHRLENSPIPGHFAPTIHEADYRRTGREVFLRSRETVDAVWADIRALLVALWQRPAVRDQNIGEDRKGSAP